MASEIICLASFNLINSSVLTFLKSRYILFVTEHRIYQKYLLRNYCDQTYELIIKNIFFLNVHLMLQNI